MSYRFKKFNKFTEKSKKDEFSWIYTESGQRWVKGKSLRVPNGRKAPAQVASESKATMKSQQIEKNERNKS